jgi:hypothetical protein
MMLKTRDTIPCRQKNKDDKEEVKKKGLHATPSNTLPWLAKRLQECILRELCIWLHHIYLPVVIARLFSALPPCDYATIA